MKPVDQTIFPIGDEGRGDCFRACVASIFELPIEKVPDFCAKRNWEEHLEEWLAHRRMGYVEVRINGEEAVFAPVPRNILCILTGHTKRHPKRLHAVVGRTEGRGLTWGYLHDPHPDKSFLTVAVHIMFFVSFDPVRPQ